VRRTGLRAVFFSAVSTLNQDRVRELDALVEHFDLNLHPFYRDWVMGELPVEKLRDYAGEYERFVGTIASGWETLGQEHYAEEEREHERLWAAFRLELGCERPSGRPSTETLVRAAQNAFSTPATAAGALYAFEAQQPATSRSKLDGLEQHYRISDEGKEYFRVHADDVAERDLLREVVSKMTDAEFAQTKTACALVGSAMWAALDGIYYANG
jgi:pyrroloquinoline-quinone synthase